MTPSTRPIVRYSTPPNKTQPHEADTVKKTKFFCAYDRKPDDESLRTFAAKQGISRTTAHSWLRQREELGFQAYRRTRPRSTHLGRPPKVSKEHCKMLIGPENPVDYLPHKAQLQYHHIDASVRTVRRQIQKVRSEARREQRAGRVQESSSQA
jgi:hypothetical protein